MWKYSSSLHVALYKNRFHKEVPHTKWVVSLIPIWYALESNFSSWMQRIFHMILVENTFQTPTFIQIVVIARRTIDFYLPRRFHSLAFLFRNNFLNSILHFFFERLIWLTNFSYNANAKNNFNKYASHSWIHISLVFNGT